MSESRPDRITVLVLTSTFPRRADDTEPAFVFELSRRLAHSYRVLVLAPHAPGALRQEDIAGVQVYRFRYFPERWQGLAYDGGILNRLRANPLRYFQVPFFILGQLLALRSLLRRERVDVIHAHWIIPQGLVIALGRRLGIVKVPVLCTSHGADLFALRGAVFTWLKRRILASCSMLTVVSTAMQQQAVALGMPPQRVRVMSMGVDLGARFTPDPGIARGSGEILFVGRLVEKKGVIHLLHAFREVVRQRTDLRLRIVGGGALQDSLQRAAAELGIATQVTFTGPVPGAELPHYYRRAALAVFPFIVASDGDQEGLGLVLVEALGCECPLLASDLAAVRDVIQPGENGLLVPPGDRDALAAGMLALLQDPGLAARLAVAGRRSVLARYDWDRVAADYAGLLEAVSR